MVVISIIFFSIFNLVTVKGKSNSRGFGKHIGIDEANRYANIGKDNKRDKESFSTIYNALKSINIIENGVRFLSGVTVKQVLNGIHLVTNSRLANVSIVGNKISSGLGENRARYDK